MFKHCSIGASITTSVQLEAEWVAGGLVVIIDQLFGLDSPLPSVGPMHSTVTDMLAPLPPSSPLSPMRMDVVLSASGYPKSSVVSPAACVDNT